MPDQRLAPWIIDLPNDLTVEQGLQLARDRIVWRAAGRPDPADMDEWSDDDQIDFYVAGRHTSDTLDLNALKLRAIPEEIATQEGLDYLFLMGNRIEIIPAAFAETFRCISLHLFGNPLRNVPAALFHMKGLTDLYLGRSALVDLPQLDRPASQLKILGLDRTEWLDIPDGFLRQFPNLRTLLLNSSFRDAIPPDVFALPELIQLDFEENPLEVLPSEINQLRKLMILNLTNCQLKSLPKSLGSLTVLEEKARGGPFGLRIGGNPFKDKELRRIAKLKNPQMTIQALEWARANGD